MDSPRASRTATSAQICSISAFKGFQVDLGTTHRPEATVARGVFEKFFIVCCGDSNELTWHLGGPPGISHAGVIVGARRKGLDHLDFSLTHPGKLGNLDNPLTGGLFDHEFRIGVDRQGISEPSSSMAMIFSAVDLPMPCSE